MAPVGDVHRRVEPRRRAPARRRAGLRAGEVRGRGQDVERHLDPNRLHRTLDDLRELRDLARLLGGERDREALRVARGRHQLLRRAEVLVPLRHALVRRRVDRRERRVVADVGEIVEEGLDDRRPVERQRDRLPHAAVVQRILQVDAHRHLPVRRAVRREDMDARLVEQRAGCCELDLADEIDLAAE